MIVLSFTQVRDPESTAKWRLQDTGIVCRVIEVDGEHHWQAWSETDMEGAILSGIGGNRSSAAKDAQQAAARLLAEEQAASEGHTGPDRVGNKAKRRRTS